jgi:hypothetical protein
MCIDGHWIDTECEELKRTGIWSDPNFTPAREGPLTAPFGWLRSPTRAHRVTMREGADA